MSKEAEELINSFNYNELDQDIERIASDMEAAEEAGADLIICYMHWGNEYQREPDDNQAYMAQALADRGADIIFASHPHVLQRVDLLESADERTVPVFYSMGNFISNQRYETLNQNRYTEQGMMAQVEVSIFPSTGEIVSQKVTVIRKSSALRYRAAGRQSGVKSGAGRLRPSRQSAAGAGRCDRAGGSGISGGQSGLSLKKIILKRPREAGRTCLAAGDR